MILSNHWDSALTHLNKFYSVKQCVKYELEDIMNNYDKYKIRKKPQLPEDPL